MIVASWLSITSLLIKNQLAIQLTNYTTNQVDTRPTNRVHDNIFMSCLSISILALCAVSFNSHDTDLQYRIYYIDSLLHIVQSSSCNFVCIRTCTLPSVQLSIMPLITDHTLYNSLQHIFHFNMPQYIIQCAIYLGVISHARFVSHITYNIILSYTCCQYTIY